jgi:hypothetical protein
MATRFVTNPRRPAARKPSSKRRTAAQSNAAKAMKLFHSGQASSLAEAWQMVRGSARRNPRSGEIETRSYFEALEPTRAKYDDLDQYDRWITHSAAAKILRKYEGKSDREVAKALGLDPDDPDVIFYIEVLRTGEYWKPNPRRSTRYPKMARLQALRDLMAGKYSRRLVTDAGLTSRAPARRAGTGDEWMDDYNNMMARDEWVEAVVAPALEKAEREYERAGGKVQVARLPGGPEDLDYATLVGGKEIRRFAKDAPKRKAQQARAMEEWYRSEVGPLDYEHNPARKYDEGRDDAGYRKLSDLKRGEFFKRKADARKTYRKGDYDRSERKYEAMDEDDISRSIYLKGDVLVYVGFDY